MTIRVVTLAGSVEREAAVVAELGDDSTFEVAFRCVDRTEVLASIRAEAADVLLSVGATSWFDFQCVQEAHGAGIKLFGLAADPIEAEALEVGGFTVVQDPSDIQVAPAAAQPPGGRPRLPEPTGKLIAVWGPKGSPGRTTVAIELATVVAQTGTSTLLIDADLYGGDIAQLLGVVEELPGLVPISRMGARGELRDDAWVQQLRSIPQGPVLLPGLLRAELWAEVSPFGWTQVLEAARRAFHTTVVDVGFCLEPHRSVAEGLGRNDVATTSVETADRIVAVVRADPIGIRSFLWSYSDHRELLDVNSMVVVVNRVRPGEELEVDRFIRKHVGRPPLVLIPDRPDHLGRANWQGLPVVRCEPSSPVSAAVRDIAASLGAPVAPKGFLTRLVGRGSRV